MSSRKTFNMLAKVVFGLSFINFAVAAGVSFPFVKTTSGKIVGHSSDTPGIVEYLGVPYAQAPVGNLRFAAPQPFNSSCKDTVFNASSFSPACPQNPAHVGKLPNSTANEGTIVSDFLVSDATIGEDCLTLNIWAPSLSPGQCGKGATTKPKAVYVWFYGGQFQTGSTQSPFYKGQYLAHAEDIIVVTANYRVNMFGFPGLASESTSLNAGMLDMRAVLEWVRTNIAAFGGDPDSITAGGQSAGAMGLDYYVHSPVWQDDPIVNGLIFESGQVSTLTPNAANKTLAGWKNVTELVGCSNSSSQSDVLSCMRNKPFKDLLAAEKSLRSLGGAAFQVTIDDSVIFSESTYQAKDLAGDLVKIPSLVGNNDYEAGFFRLEAAASNITTTNSTIWQLVNLAAAVCPTHFAAGTRHNHSIPVWRYRYFGQWPNLQLYPTSGAWHGSETPLVFGTANDLTDIKNTERENEVSRYMMKAWGAFIRDPIHGLGGAGLGWPMYEGAGTKTLVELSKDFGNNATGSPVATFADPAPFDVGCNKVGYEGQYSF